MGFTQDGVPYVGQLAAKTTGRPGNGQWIACGFNGYGMPYCWMAGEALANMILGQDVSDWLPEAFLVSEGRLSPAGITRIAEALASLR